MGNCLVTQLKEAVSNDNLEYFEGIIVEFLGGGNNPQYIDVTSQDADLTLTIVEGDFNFVNSAGVDSGLKEVTLPAGRSSWYGAGAFLIPANGVGKVLVRSKYSIDRISSVDAGRWSAPVKVGLAQLKHCSNLKKVLSGGSNSACFYGDFKDLSNSLENIVLPTSGNTIVGDITGWTQPNLKEFKLSYAQAGVIGSISALNLPSLEILHLFRTGASGLTGDIIGLGRSVNLSEVDISYSSFTGSLDALATAIITNKPNRAGTLAITGNGVITYKENGDGTGANVVVPNETVKTITFDGQGGYTIA